MCSEKYMNLPLCGVIYLNAPIFGLPYIYRKKIIHFKRIVFSFFPIDKSCIFDKNRQRPARRVNKAGEKKPIFRYTKK